MGLAWNKPPQEWMTCNIGIVELWMASVQWKKKKQEEVWSYRQAWLAFCWQPLQGFPRIQPNLPAVPQEPEGNASAEGPRQAHDGLAGSASRITIFTPCPYSCNANLAQSRSPWQLGFSPSASVSKSPLLWDGHETVSPRSGLRAPTLRIKTGIFRKNNVEKQRCRHIMQVAENLPLAGLPLFLNKVFFRSYQVMAILKVNSYLLNFRHWAFQG